MTALPFWKVYWLHRWPKREKRGINSSKTSIGFHLTRNERLTVIVCPWVTFSLHKQVVCWSWIRTAKSEIKRYFENIGICEFNRTWGHSHGVRRTAVYNNIALFENDANTNALENTGFNSISTSYGTYEQRYQSSTSCNNQQEWPLLVTRKTSFTNVMDQDGYCSEINISPSLLCFCL